MARDDRSTQFRVGAIVGPWKLLKRLGGTGNSEVWEARRREEVLAVKLLRGRGATRYQRFKDEIRFLREMAPPEGVLPWRDSHLPERITRADPAWLAMPVAEPIIDALAKVERPAREAVVAVRDIASTLAGLASRGIAHRDLKPGNLFRLNGDWVVGDFGLVDYPNKPELTRPNQKLGPAHFVADEMINQPDTADPHPADVFSLAKTLWVLCVGQDYPPSGQQRIEVEPATIGHWVRLPQIEQLDLLVERATALNPASRPTMEQFAAELKAWLDPARKPPAADLAATAARISALSEAGLRAKQLRDRRREFFTAAIAQIEEHLDALVERLATVFPTAARHSNPPLMSDFGHHTEPARIEQQDTRGAFATNADPDAVTLMLGIAAQWVAEDDARYGAWIHVEDRYAGSRLLWSDGAPAALGSARQDQLLASLREELSERLPEAVNFVAGRLELRIDRDRYASWNGDASGLPFSSPSGVLAPFAYDDAGCYVVDAGNNRVRRFGPGGIELEWQMQSGRGPGEGQLHDPVGGCFTHERKVWIADHDSRRLLYFDEHGGPLHGFGVASSGPDVLRGPTDVASAPDGTVFVADRLRNCVVVFDMQGNHLDSWGDHGREPGQLSAPCGIAARHGAYIYVSDSGNDRIQKFDREGNLINWWGGTGAGSGYFHAPHGIALDNDENVYLADSKEPPHPAIQFRWRADPRLGIGREKPRAVPRAAWGGR